MSILDCYLAKVSLFVAMVAGIFGSYVSLAKLALLERVCVAFLGGVAIALLVLIVWAMLEIVWFLTTMYTLRTKDWMDHQWEKAARIVGRMKDHMESR